MDKAALVGPDLEEGRKFLQLLKEDGIPIKAALWQWDQEWGEDWGEWKLTIVTPLVDELGLKRTYGKLDDALSAASPRPRVNLLNVSVLTTDSWFYKSLRRELRKARDLPISRRRVGDHVVQDGFIYFVD